MSDTDDRRRILYAEFTALPGCEKKVAQLLGELSASVQAELGNLVFAASRRSSNSLAFFVYEEYLDEDAFQKHLAAEHGARFNEALRDLVYGGESKLTWLVPIAQS